MNNPSHALNKLCRLCRKSKELCHSHILPEFLYQPLYDERHRFFVVTAGAPRTRYGQHGLTKKLLCSTCEQQFGKNEKYASEVMRGRLGHRFRKAGNRIVIGNIDYTRFKLFQMSILWRGAVTSLDFFRFVSIGPHEERLREMLLEGEPGRSDEYGRAVIFTTERGESIIDTFFNPEPLRWCGHRMMKFFFAGSAWIFHCDKRRAPAYLENLFLQLDGTMTGLTGDLAEAKFLWPSAKRVAKRLDR